MMKKGELTVGTSKVDNAYVVVFLIAVFLFVMVVMMATADAQTICDTGVKYNVELSSDSVATKMIVTGAGDRIFIVGVDKDKDGYYEFLVFDTDGDGKVDVQLSGGMATIEQAIELYCSYAKDTMSSTYKGNVSM